MKVVIFSNSLWNIYNFRKNLIKFLINKGITVYAIGSNDAAHIKLKKIKCKVILVNKLDRNTNIFYFLILFLKIFFILRKIKPNILLSFTIKPNLISGLICRFLKIPCIVMITGMGYVFTIKSILFYPIKFIYRICFRKVNYIFFQNKDDFIFFKNEIILNKKYKILPGSGVDLKRFYFSKVKKQKKINFLMISRNLKEKGIFELVESIKIISKKYLIYKNINFTHLGFLEGSKKYFISENFFKLWKKNKLMNYIKKQDDVRKYIKKSHCLILPTYREGLPRSILEGFSMGRPAIVSKTIGTKNLIKSGKNGYYCKVKDPKSLSKKIIKFFYLSYEDKLRMSYFSRLYAMQFDEKYIINSYWNIIAKFKEKDAR